MCKKWIDTFCWWMVASEFKNMGFIYSYSTSLFTWTRREILQIDNEPTVNLYGCYFNYDYLFINLNVFMEYNENQALPL